VPVRPTLNSRRPRLLVASLVVVAPGWLVWLLQGADGSLVSPTVTTLILASLAALTWLKPALKGRVVRLFQKYVLNPPVRAFLLLGVLPIGYSLLETKGRVSGKPRRTPVGDGLVGDTFWIVAEHGYSANYVRNLQAEPAVRVQGQRRPASGLAPRDRPRTRRR